MKNPIKLSNKYFLKYKEHPVSLKNYDEKQYRIARIYVDKISKLLDGFKVKLMVRGSTAFKILGKGEVEVGVYTNSKNWNLVIESLSKTFGIPENLDKNYARFNDNTEEIEIEIIVLKGHEAKVDIRLHEFLLDNPKYLKKYVMIKKKYAYSKREYQKQKHKFLSKIIELIP